MKQYDVRFLAEYHAFGYLGPIIIARNLHAALLGAHEKKDYDTVAHLQLRLHAEMVMCLESAGALLLAYSKWDQPGGILGSLLGYRPGDVPRFLEQLADADDVLLFLGFPCRDDVLKHCDDERLVEKAYTSEELKGMVVNTCQMYLSEDVRTAYNKLKHGGLAVRNPALFLSNPPQVVVGADVHVIVAQNESGTPEFSSFRVTGEDGIRMANKYLNNIEVIVARSQALAGFVAYFLEDDLMRRPRG